MDSLFVASFIGVPPRSPDFDRAYGADAWNGFVHAHTFLYAIPLGRFVDQLDLDLLAEVNRRVHAPDTGMKARLLRAAAMVVRGGRWDRAGELRDGRQLARPDRYTAAELANLVEAGIKVRLLTGDAAAGGQALLEYPSPQRSRQVLPNLLANVKTDLLVGINPIRVAAEFQRRLVALHPFGDANGRTSRILMNRILAEFDLPPAIVSDPDRDISRGAAGWCDEVIRGIARSKEFLAFSSSHIGPTSAASRSSDGSGAGDTDPDWSVGG